MKIKNTLKSKMARYMLYGMTALAVMGTSSFYFSKPSYAAEAITNNNQTLYQKIPKAEALKMIKLAKANGTVRNTYDNTLIIELDSKLYEYSYYDAGEVYVDENTHYDGVDNIFNNMDSALQFIKDMLMEDGDIDHCSGVTRQDNTTEWTYVAIKGHIPLMNLSIKEYEENKCTSIKLESYKTKMYTGDYSTTVHAEMNGGYADDLVWTTPNPNVTLSPAGEYCTVTATDAVGTVFLRATAKGGATNYIYLEFLV